jgi:hypothetical protein
VFFTSFNLTEEKDVFTMKQKKRNTTQFLWGGVESRFHSLRKRKRSGWDVREGEEGGRASFVPS